MKRTSLFRTLSCWLSVGVLSWPAAVMAQATYPNPEAAGDALIAALVAGDKSALQRVLGKQAPELVPLDSIDAEDRLVFAKKASEAHAVAVTGERAELTVGNDKWAFPIPMARTKDGLWRFDPTGGREAMLERTLGANERSAMQAALAYVDAQREYATADRNGDGVPEYARKLVSTAGKRDGLIWSPKLGDESPLGEAFLPSRPDQGYHGYRYRILDGQGPRAPGGARSYLLGNRLLSGFALIAWPVSYGRTGVMTFIVNQDGVVYERDLGPNTAKAATGIKLFDPDDTWKRAQP